MAKTTLNCLFGLRVIDILLHRLVYVMQGMGPGPGGTVGIGLKLLDELLEDDELDDELLDEDELDEPATTVNKPVAWNPPEQYTSR